MTKRKRDFTKEELESWVLLWIADLGLCGWTIRMDYPKQDDDTDMRINWTEDRCIAVLSVFPRVFNQSRARAWHCICHEMLHMAFAPMDDVIVSYIGVARVFDQYRDASERCIDRLAGCLCQLIPTPGHGIPQGRRVAFTKDLRGMLAPPKD